METGFNCEEILRSEGGFAAIDANSMKKHHNSPLIHSVIDTMGALSSKSQGLKSVITTTTRMLGSDNTLYVKSEGTKCLGILKMGHKSLFIRHNTGNISQIYPLCCLDFYVHESVQRGGIGRKLFDFMLNKENVQPHKLAYDRPSSKLIGFLNKHFKLNKYIPQNNNFVVFSQYFDTYGEAQATGKGRGEFVGKSESRLSSAGQMMMGNGGGRVGYSSSVYAEAPREQYKMHQGNPIVPSSIYATYRPPLPPKGETGITPEGKENKIEGPRQKVPPRAPGSRGTTDSYSSTPKVGQLPPRDHFSLPSSAIISPSKPTGITTIGFYEEKKEPTRPPPRVAHDPYLRNIERKMKDTEGALQNCEAKIRELENKTGIDFKGEKDERISNVPQLGLGIGRGSAFGKRSNTSSSAYGSHYAYKLQHNKFYQYIITNLLSTRL